MGRRAGKFLGVEKIRKYLFQVKQELRKIPTNNCY
jgi:preprotein translocase subunit SecE